MKISSICEWYFVRSKGQLPEIFTKYKIANMWKGNQFDNSKLKGISWLPAIKTTTGIEEYFSSLKKTKL
jgi:hypothetical protein